MTLLVMEIEESAPAPEAVPEVVEAQAPEAVDAGAAAAGDTPVEPVADESPAAAPVEEPTDPYADFGGRDVVERAHQLYERTRSEDGVIELFLDAGRNLGLDLKQMQALFEDLSGGAAEPPDPDEPITRREWEEHQAAQRQAAAASQAEAAQQINRQALHAVVTELGIHEDAMSLVLALGDKHIKGEPTPETIAAAVRSGFADYQATIEREAQAYLTKKVEKAAGVPSAPVGAGAPSEPADAEPQNTAEAIKVARKKLGLSR